jgi:hypothetical protein
MTGWRSVSTPRVLIKNSVKIPSSVQAAGQNLPMGHYPDDRLE